MRIQIIGPISESTKNLLLSQQQTEPADESAQDPSFDFVFSTIGIPGDFNDYDLNIICLDDKQFWINSHNMSTDTVDLGLYLEPLSHHLSEAKSPIVIVLPHQNISFQCRNNRGAHRSIPINTILNDIASIISELTRYSYYGDGLSCVSGATTIAGRRLDTDFFINNAYGNVLATFDNSSNKVTAVRNNNVVVTTLPLLESREPLAAFTTLLNEPTISEAPTWFGSLPLMFDDAQLRKTIAIEEAAIEEARERITNAKAKLEKNDEYKSILYENGTALEKTVRTMLGDIFNWDPEDFEDVGTSDFIIRHGDKYFVGEIKGENSNVTNKHLSQLQLNLDTDQGNGRIPEDAQTVGLLIANTFRKTEPSTRPPVDEKQIAIARDRYESLIVTTPVLLKLYEAVLLGRLEKADAISLLSRKGMLLESDIGLCDQS